MEAALREFMGPTFLLVGLSHVAQPAAWVRFFAAVKSTGVAGLIIGMYTLPFGLVLLVGHPSWRWEPAVFLTVVGYGQTFKGALYLAVPQLADQMIERNLAKSLWSYRIAGALMTALAGVVTWQAWAARLGSSY